MVYVPGRTVNRMSGAYRGEGKTDAKDARVVADQARMRPKGFDPPDTPPELGSTLRVLTNHRADLIADRVRLVNRLRDLLGGVCPALERAIYYSAAKGPVVMLTEYQTPAALCRLGAKRLTTWLQRRKVRGADTVAVKAVEAAQSQQIALPGDDREIREMFRTDERAEIIESMPGSHLPAADCPPVASAQPERALKSVDLTGSLCAGISCELSSSGLDDQHLWLTWPYCSVPQRG